MPVAAVAVAVTGLLAGLLAAAWTPGRAAAQAAEPLDLARYRWRHRVLVFFAPSADDPAYRAEAAALRARAADARARDILAAAVFERGAGAFDGRPLAAADAEALRRRFRAPAGRFSAVLLGKDGRTTLRLARPVVEGRLFPAVDAMPMGAAEARRRGR